jgi:HD-GYP domain-containing protein (c-di-GMP phosphodiesterase class II)
VPLEGEHGLLGVLNVTDPVSERPFNAEDCTLLLHLARRVAAGWEQTLAMEDNQNDVEGAARALRGVLDHLERSRKVAPDRVLIARAVARELQLAESEVGLIAFAASIHDIGMTRLGERVTECAETLSDEERAAVRQHPEEGAELLKPLETMGAVRDIVLTHHEWWDGSGYPRGLEGEAIPIGGRILAVVDAFESMTVGRAHRTAIPVRDAVAEMNLLKGKQFDPAVVEALERAWPEIEKQKHPRTPDSREHTVTTQGGE